MCSSLGPELKNQKLYSIVCYLVIQYTRVVYLLCSKMPTRERLVLAEADKHGRPGHSVLLDGQASRQLRHCLHGYNRKA